MGGPPRGSKMGRKDRPLVPYRKLTSLDEIGVHTVCSVLNVEYQRCQERDDPTVKGYNGISIVKKDIQVDEKKVRELIRKTQEKG